MYELHEIDGVTHAATLHRFNSMVNEWPPLEDRHLKNGYWWLAVFCDEAVAMAGLVPMEPFQNVGYLKRCLVLPDHHGHGLQYRLMMARELRARQLGWSMLVSECAADNPHSANNFRRAGFEPVDPEQKWGAVNSVYWAKTL